MPFPKLSFFESKKTLLLTHAGTDVDSFSSAAAVYFSLNNKKNAQIGVLDHINLSAKALAQSLRVPYTINPSLENFDCIVVFDFNDFEMAGTKKEALKSFSGKIFAIDHHKTTAFPIALHKNSLIDEKAVSATEIVYKWFKKSKTSMGKNAAQCIACGIIVDSAGFHVADSSTFRIMGDVFEKTGTTFSDLVGLFEVKHDLSETVAKLKAAKRIKIFKSFDRLIVFSDVGSFESSAAMAFTFLGASIAFVGNEDNGKILVSARAKNSVVKNLGFDLVEHVFLPLEKKFGGRGGGHAGAAAFNVQRKNLQEILKECVNLTHEFFQKKLGKKEPLKEYA